LPRPKDPSASPSPSPSPAAAADSSPGSSTASDAGLVADAGPVFDPNEVDDDRTAPPELDEPNSPAWTPDDLWDEQRVRSVLQAKGLVLHGLLAVDPSSDEWSYTDDDLSAIAPPLTRILNRYDATRAAAAAGDELAVAVGFGGYAIRSYGQRKAALAMLELAQQRERAAGGTPHVTLAPDVAAAAGADDDEIEPSPPLAPRVR
jgi:hypothetical protein